MGVYPLLAFSVGVLLSVLLMSRAMHAAEGAALLLDPATGTITVDSTFDVSILLDTGGVSVNTVEAYLEFPADKLQVVTPSAGNSVISIWLQQPVFSNQKGTVNFVGGIPGNGIRTSSALISTITFRAKAPGESVIKILGTSGVFAANGSGTKITTTFGRAAFTVIPRAPDGPVVFSVTHPDQDTWYRNNNAQLGWDAQEGVTAYSHVFDQDPSTLPPTADTTTGTGIGIPTIADGIWYFHIKQKRHDLYGDVSHYRVKIDTALPAEFKPSIDFLAGAIGRPAVVNFFTTDMLSGMDHYEVAVYDRSQDAGQAPIFVEAASPYRIPAVQSGDMRVVVRAFDRAGNTRDGVIDFYATHFFLSFFRANRWLTLTILALMVIPWFLLLRNRKKQLPAPVLLPPVYRPAAFEYPEVEQQEEESKYPHQT